MSTGGRRLSLLQAACASGLLLLCLGALAHAIFFSEHVPFIRRAGGAAWITARMPTTSNLIGVDLNSVPVFTFVKRFGAKGDGGRARLEVRALQSVDLWLNGDPIRSADPGDGWRRPFRTELGQLLRSGRNELRAEVRNPHGPALLQLRLELEGDVIESDESWSVITPGANPGQAVIADDRRIHPDSRLLPEPGQILAERALPILLLFIGSALGCVAGGRLLSGRMRGRMPQATLAVITLFWLAVFIFKLSQLTVMVGFDVPAHLLYIDFILKQHALPLASDGFSSYHPPIFHLLTSALVALFDVSPESAGGQVVYRLITFASGLANVWLVYFAARRLWPNDALKTSLAVAAAGLLPMNIYMSAYVSNEPLHAAWVSLSLFLAIRLLLAKRTPTRELVALSGVLGLALLTKFTSLLIAPLVAAIVACKVWLIERRTSGALRVLTGILSGAALISGWFYLRNWLAFGNAVVWNLNVPGAPTWWMQPGFHTAAYYTGFGEALRNPFFAGFHSFWDGAYSTLWGDGLVGGMIRVGTRHPMWNYDFMTLCYWLAFPATLLIGVGFARMVRACFKSDDLARRLAFTLMSSLLFLLAFSLFYITLSLPFYAQAKAFYVLAAILPLSLAAAEGLSIIPKRLREPRHEPLRAIYFGWLGSLAGAIATAYLG